MSYNDLTNFRPVHWHHKTTEWYWISDYRRRACQSRPHCFGGSGALYLLPCSTLFLTKGSPPHRWQHRFRLHQRRFGRRSRQVAQQQEARFRQGRRFGAHRRLCPSHEHRPRTREDFFLPGELDMPIECCRLPNADWPNSRFPIFYSIASWFCVDFISPCRLCKSPRRLREELLKFSTKFTSSRRMRRWALPRPRSLECWTSILSPMDCKSCRLVVSLSDMDNLQFGFDHCLFSSFHSLELSPTLGVLYLFLVWLTHLDALHNKSWQYPFTLFW